VARRLTSSRFAVLLICLGCALLFAALRYVDPPPLRMLELRGVDAREKLRGPLPVGSEVAIIAIDEQSLTELGRWPWPRTRIAELITRLTNLGPAAIALDIVFAEPQPEDDPTLARAIRDSGKVVLGYFIDFAELSSDQSPVGLSSYNMLKPGLGRTPGEFRLPNAPRVVGNLPEIAASAGRAGYFNMLPDDDGIFRRVPLGIRYAPHGGAPRVLSPLSLEALRRTQRGTILGMAFDDAGVTGVTLAGIPIPVDANGNLWVNYAGPSHTFPHYSAADVIAGRVEGEALRNRIVLVGTTATGTYDIRSTPFDPVSSGVEIHANVIENVLRGRFIVIPRWLASADSAVIIFTGIVLGIALTFFKGMRSITFLFGVLVASFGASQLLFVRQGIPLTMVYQILSVVSQFGVVGIFHYMTEAREKHRIRSAFELYLEPSVARLVSEDPSLLRLHGEKKDLTVLFADLRNFTTVTEVSDPEKLVEFMNEYLGTMTAEIFRHNGLVDKYIGDAIMALWGAPVTIPDHAVKACQAALDMVGCLETLQDAWRRLRGAEQGAVDLRQNLRLGMGVGINTGQMVVGNIGSERRFNYTVIGDAVNLASRLEACNKLYGTRILIGEVTREAIGDACLLREIDSVRVKGKRLPVRIFELLAKRSDSALLGPFAAAFEDALRAYRERDWPPALRRFEEFVREYPDDTPGRIYVERCRLLIESPPDEAWDGVYSFASKDGSAGA
jgi:adenylate cyclase